MNKRLCRAGAAALGLALLTGEQAERGGLRMEIGGAVMLALLLLGAALLALGGALTAGYEKSARASGTGSDAGARKSTHITDTV